MPTDFHELERLAAERLEPAALEYFTRGSGDGLTLAANIEAWRGLRVRPRVLRDMTTVHASTTVLGAPVNAPVLVAPMAMQRFACDDGELATARGAATTGTVMVVSMASTCSLEDVAAAAPTAPRWAQMYLLRDRGRTRDLAARAGAAGYQAIVASVDGASVPHGHGGVGARLVVPPSFRFPNLSSPDAPNDPNLLAMVNDFDPAVTFDDLASFGEWSGLPVVVKGVMRGDDAARCVDAGAAGVCVSNHGGRIVDGCVATAEVLPQVVDAVGGRAEIYVDGGIRRGVDVLAALALGARAVLVGRPVLWGLTVGGDAGVAAVLESLTAEIVRVMAFCGASNVDEITPDLVARAN
ncbi:MAG: alpha-hydroxy acid oxidase [Acidimicrobiia bacterium]